MFFPPLRSDPRRGGEVSAEDLARLYYEIGRLLNVTSEYPIVSTVGPTGVHLALDNPSDALPSTIQLVTSVCYDPLNAAVTLDGYGIAGSDSIVGGPHFLVGDAASGTLLDLGYGATAPWASDQFLDLYLPTFHLATAGTLNVQGMCSYSCLGGGYAGDTFELDLYVDGVPEQVNYNAIAQDADSAGVIIGTWQIPLGAGNHTLALRAYVGNNIQTGTAAQGTVYFAIPGMSLQITSQSSIVVQTQELPVVGTLSDPVCSENPQNCCPTGVSSSSSSSSTALTGTCGGLDIHYYQRPPGYTNFSATFTSNSLDPAWATTPNGIAGQSNLSSGGFAVLAFGVASPDGTCNWAYNYGAPGCMVNPCCFANMTYYPPNLLVSLPQGGFIVTMGADGWDTVPPAGHGNQFSIIWSPLTVDSIAPFRAHAGPMPVIDGNNHQIIDANGVPVFVSVVIEGFY